MKFAGSFFVQDGISVKSSDNHWPITICFDGSGGLWLNMTQEMAERLHRELGHVLDGAEHDRAEMCES
jgi:hypothetical protein